MRDAPHLNTLKRIPGGIMLVESKKRGIGAFGGLPNG